MNDTQKQRKVEASLNHKANIAASLKHRLEVAKTNQDKNLINLLEKEMNQVGLNQSCFSISNKFKEPSNVDGFLLYIFCSNSVV